MQRRRGVISHERTFLSRRVIGASGVPTPRSPLKSVCAAPSRSFLNRATSSQKLTSEQREPACSILARNRRICVLFPAPSIPEKLTNMVRLFLSSARIDPHRSTSASIECPSTRLAWSCMRQCHYGSNGNTSCRNHSHSDHKYVHAPLLCRRNCRSAHS